MLFTPGGDRSRWRRWVPIILARAPTELIDYWWPDRVACARRHVPGPQRCVSGVVRVSRSGVVRVSRSPEQL